MSVRDRWPPSDFDSIGITRGKFIPRRQGSMLALKVKSYAEKLARTLLAYGMPSGRPTYLHLLCLGWLLTQWYGERYYPYQVISKCKWDPPMNLPSQFRVSLVADPQLIDENTYPGRPKAFLAITKYVVDTYLRRNWIYMNNILDPDANIFLGDLFDGGREWSDPEWLQEYDRWNRIFTKPPLKRTIMNVPGNHDIGYGDTVVPHALNRFKAYFGETNSVVDIEGYSFVLLDTLSLMNTQNASIFQPPRDFLNSLDSIISPEKHRILVTHVPLYRPPNSNCGHYRESSKGLPYTYGYQYQTLITPEVSKDILTAVRPFVVFTGDDHDACHVRHEYSIGVDSPEMRTADEFTVKSFSMAMGIGKPGIQLLTLSNSYEGATNPVYTTSICLMPSPFHAFALYGIFGFISVAVIVLFNLFPSVIPRSLIRLSKEIHPPQDLPIHVGRRRHIRRSDGLKLVRSDFLILGTWVLTLFIYFTNSV